MRPHLDIHQNIAVTTVKQFKQIGKNAHYMALMLSPQRFLDLRVPLGILLMLCPSLKYALNRLGSIIFTKSGLLFSVMERPNCTSRSP